MVPVLSCRSGCALLSAAAIAAAIPAYASDADGTPRLTLDASVRARMEAIEGQYRPDTAAEDIFVSFRTTVAAKVDLAGFTLGGEVVDARGYAQRANSSVRTGEVNALEPVQAYAAYAFGGLSRGTTMVTAGRFALDIGSSRLVGRADFPNTVPSYLGAKAEWARGKDRIVAFWTRPFQALPASIEDIRDNRVALDRAGHNLTFLGASGTAARAFGQTSVELYGYRLAENDRTDRPTRNRHLVTAGSRVRLAPANGQFDYEIEAAYQWGRVRLSTAAADVRDKAVSAGFVHVESGWTIASGWSPRLAAMFDYASGDGAGAHTYGRFDALYGAARGDFGPRALFNAVGRSNLLSPGIRLEAKPSRRLDWMLEARDLWLADKTDAFNGSGVRDRSGDAGSHVGVQLEGRARRWLVPERLRLEIGGAYLAKGAFLERAPNAPRTSNTRYGYVDLSAAF